MPLIEIYTKATCVFCHLAKRLLRAKGAAYTEIELHAHPERRAEMISRANQRTTVPQIFIDGRHVGGWDDLNRLDRAGQLDPLLG